MSEGKSEFVAVAIDKIDFDFQKKTEIYEENSQNHSIRPRITENFSINERSKLNNFNISRRLLLIE